MGTNKYFVSNKYLLFKQIKLYIFFLFNFEIDQQTIYFKPSFVGKYVLKKWIEIIEIILLNCFLTTY